MEEIDATVGQSHIIQCEELCYDATSSVILMSSAEMFEVKKYLIAYGMLGALIWQNWSAGKQNRYITCSSQIGTLNLIGLECSHFPFKHTRHILWSRTT